MRISFSDSGRRFMYPIINTFSRIANTEAICFAKIAVYPLLLAVSTDVKYALFHENSCFHFVLKAVGMPSL